MSIFTKLTNWLYGTTSVAPASAPAPANKTPVAPATPAKPKRATKSVKSVKTAKKTGKKKSKV